MGKCSSTSSSCINHFINASRYSLSAEEAAQPQHSRERRFVFFAAVRVFRAVSA